MSIDIAPLRIGVLRAVGASADITVAVTEARVVRVELERRLGPVTLDLRCDESPVGPWLPRAHAAWPADVDATIDLTGLGALAPTLVSLFPRTVDAGAAEVRRRMLDHLGALPSTDEPLTDDLLASLLPAPARPTDLWLVVRSAATLATGDPAHRALRDHTDATVTALDHWFDQAVDGLAPDHRAVSIQHLQAEVADLRARLVAATDDLTRVEREALDRITDLETGKQILRERLDRADLDRTAT